MIRFRSPPKRWFSALIMVAGAMAAHAENWPEWRGPHGSGICAEKGLPIAWSTNQNVRWKTALPEPGNSTPVIWDDCVFVTQAVGNRRTVICLERPTGNILWQSGVIAAQKEPTHETNPYCSGSPATDGQRVIVSFGSAGVYCYDFHGKELWHRELGKQSHMWGVSSSPVIRGDLCFLNFGPGDRTFLVALNRRTGKTVWQHEEAGGKSDKYIGSWSTPIVIDVENRKELIAPWPERLAAYDPQSGQELWSCRGLNPLVYTSPLYADGIVVVMGGFNGSMLAVKAGGSGDVTASNRLWQVPKTRQRIGSGIISEGYIYIVDDPGMAECLELRTGKLVWEERLKGPGAKADNWSSLVLAENHLYAVNQSGDGFVFAASPQFQVLSTNSLGELTRASVAVSNGELFIRTYKHLWCIGANGGRKYKAAMLPLLWILCRPRKPRPLLTFVALSSKRANGLLSPTLSSRGGEGDIPRWIESNRCRSLPLLLWRRGLGRGGLSSTTVDLLTWGHGRGEGERDNKFRRVQKLKVLPDKLLNPKFVRPFMVALLLGGTMATSAQDEPPGGSQARSMVISRYGIVATEHPFASQAGANVLAQGGNAVDAAIAANAVMGVVGPMANGIGGDMFAIVYEAKSGKLYGLNASGWAPAALTPPFLKSRGLTRMATNGIHSVTVPGVVDGWDQLNRRFGRKKLSTLLAPAIRYADEGFPVSEIFSSYWVASQRKLRRDTNAARTFLIDDRAPRPGEIFHNRDLAESLRQIARGGRNAFYKGAISRKLLQTSNRLGGTMTAQDLAKFSSQWVEPISTTYHGWTVYELPPNGQGIGALLMLNLMEKFPLSQFGQNSAEALHVMIEAKKLAYADVLRYVCDPQFHKVPVSGMLSKEYAAERAKLIDLGHANCNVPAGQPPAIGTDTTYLCTVDADGNMVSYIQSNYESFGSGLVPAGAGFALQNRGALFSLDESSPNVLAGRKRPLHTIIPAFMSKGDLRIAFGIMGGWNQSQAHAQFVSDLVDHQMNIQAALEAPRFTKQTFAGCDVEIESRIPEKIRQELAAKGHEIKLRGPFSSSVGGGQAVMRDFEGKINYGASDPRKDGAAIPEEPRR